MNFENTAQEMTVVNDSLLFHTSNRTAFLLGGWPEGAQVWKQSPLQGNRGRGWRGRRRGGDGRRGREEKGEG